MGNRWAVLIGINGYHESLGPLNFCTNDAKLMQETLVSECCGFAPESIVLLTDDQPKDRLPTFGNIHSWLGTWLSRPEADDLVLVYFAGHGREANNQALLAPLDATLESLPVTGIPIQYISDLLERCKASQKVLILDACHSGAGRDVTTMTTGFRDALDTGKGLYTIASCDADQISYEWPEKGHGVFTHYLVEAICSGALPDSHGNVTLDSVYEWVRKGVWDWCGDRRVRQEPVRICRIRGQISVARRRPGKKGARRRAESGQERVRRNEGVAQRPNEDQQKPKPSAEPFVFLSGHKATDLEELARLCAEHQDEAAKHLKRGDLEPWLECRGHKWLAEYAARIRAERLRSEDAVLAFLQSCGKSGPKLVQRLVAEREEARRKRQEQEAQAQRRREREQREAREREQRQRHHEEQAALRTRTRRRILGVVKALATMVLVMALFYGGYRLVRHMAKRGGRAQADAGTRMLCNQILKSLRAYGESRGHYPEEEGTTVEERSKNLWIALEFNSVSKKELYREQSEGPHGGITYGFRDAYGRTIDYRGKAGGKPMLISAGQDGVFGTKDDIRRSFKEE